MVNIKDYTGATFGRLLAVERIPNGKRTLYRCVCSCGNEAFIRGDALTSGVTRSCGCLQLEAIREGANATSEDWGTRLHTIYTGMKDRCYNRTSGSGYKRYGGRGIKVCKEWLDSYQCFKDWSLHNGYSDDLTIDRIDNDGDYEPTNCRWVTYKVQNNNRSNNKLITFRSETKTLAQWCEELNYSYSSTLHLIRKGKRTIEDILTRPHKGKGFNGSNLYKKNRNGDK